MDTEPLSRLRRHAPQPLRVPPATTHAGLIPLLTPLTTVPPTLLATDDTARGGNVDKDVGNKEFTFLVPRSWPEGLKMEPFRWWMREVAVADKPADKDWWRMRMAAAEPVAAASLCLFLKAQCAFDNVV